MSVVAGFPAVAEITEPRVEAGPTIAVLVPRGLVARHSISLMADRECLHVGEASLVGGPIRFRDVDEDTVELMVFPTRRHLAELVTIAGSDSSVWVSSSASPFPLTSVPAKAVIPRTYDDDYLRELVDRTDFNQWSIDLAMLRNGVLHLLGWWLTSDDDGSLLPQVTIDATHDAVVSRALAPEADQRFWFLPRPKIRGFYAKASIERSVGFSEISLDSPDGSAGVGHKRLPIFQFLGGDLALPLPPLPGDLPGSSLRTSQGTYLNSGYTDYRRTRQVALDSLDRDSLAGVSLLDWGIGYARVARYFVEDQLRLTGVDVDADSIAWCRANIPGEFQTVPVVPPTHLPDEHFDVVILRSLLSDLTHAEMQAMLTEVSRILSYRGVALVSFIGECASIPLVAGNRRALESLKETGFLVSESASEIDVVEGHEFYRSTLMLDDWAHSMFSERFHVQDIIRGGAWQAKNIAVLRKRFELQGTGA